MLRKAMLCTFFMIIAIGYSQGNINLDDIEEQGRFVPKLMSYQGYLTDTLGIPIDDTLDMTFSIYDGVTSGNLWWTETQTNIPIERGVFSIILGNNNTIPDSVFVDGTDRWLELILEGPDTLSPRTRMTSTGFAYMATYSDTAEYARNAISDNDWVRGTPDSVLYTSNFLGIARGSVDNMLYGAWVCSHTNLGVTCTTGTSGSDNFGCTVTGGLYNNATESYTFIGAGRDNTSSGWASVICGGDSNLVSGQNGVIVGGHDNTVSGDFSVVAGGQQNQVSQPNATISGGYNNTVADDYATISGGYNNYVRGIAANIGGGSEHVIGGNYACIPGGYADTIDLGADYSYLFGIGSKLTKDSTFMVDMPHIHFGSQSGGYEFPSVDGSADQVLVTNGGGSLSWTDGSDFSHWTVTDSVLYTKDFWGLARGSAGNVLYSTDSAHTHVNLGRICTTGTSGASFHSITIGGGSHNCADSNWSTVAGGLANKVIGAYSCISGGAYNEINSRHGTICAGYQNTVNSIHGGVFSGYYCDAGNDPVLDTGITVTGGLHNDAFADYSFIGGGRHNYIDGKYSVIVGGYADTIAAGADYSYLFGIEAKCTEDSTFMVDMPHIWFGNETSGYEFPVTDGSMDQFMVTDGSGQLTWEDVSSFSKWSVNDSVLYTNLLWGLARGGAGNYAIGESTYSHINFGTACTTGVVGQDRKHVIIGGGYDNVVQGNYTAICGGYSNTIDNNYGMIGGGQGNTCGYYGVIGGGWNNLASGNYSVVGGGWQDTVKAYYGGVLSGHINLAGDELADTGAVIVGGNENSATAKFAFVGGGQSNTASDDWAVVCGGGGNTVNARLAVICGGANGEINDDYSVIVGGAGNIIDGSESFIGGGQANYISGDRAVIGGGYQDSVVAIYGAVLSGYQCQAGIVSADTAAVVCGGWDNQARADYSFTGGGESNTAVSVHSTCVGGYSNTAYSTYSAVVGGRQNTAQGTYSGIVGGYNNQIYADRAFIGCGSGNRISGFSSVICAGENNRAIGDYSVVAGGIYDSTEAFCGGILTGWYNNAGNENSDSFAVIVGGYNNSAIARYAFIGNGNGNSATGNHCIVVGGLNNTASVLRTFVGGGYDNTSSADGAAICGGLENNADGWFSFVGGGYADTVMAYWGCIAGGYSNLAGNATSDTAATVVGGWNNTVNAKYSVIAGGKDNEVNYTYSAICGGSANEINEDYSFIGGGFDNTTNGDRAFIGGGYRNTTGTDYHTFIGNGFENYNYGYCSAIPDGYRDTLTSNADYSMAFGNYVYINDDHFVILYDGSNSGCLWINADHHDITPGNWPVVVGTSTSNGNTAYLTPGGVWTDGTFDRTRYDVQPITRATILSKIKQIPILRYKSKNSSEQHIVPDAEEFNREFNIGIGKANYDNSHISATDMAGVSLVAIKELTSLVEDLQKENTELKKRLEILERKSNF